MGTIKDNKKFKRTKEQTNPTNPTGDTKLDVNKFDIDKKTIKDQQSKKWFLVNNVRKPIPTFME